MEELRAQYARISMDASRTKEAAELRNKIAEMQKKNAWRIAEEEAEATKEGLDDQIQAYDKFVEDGDEALEKFLEDANNFADEVQNVLKMTYEDMINWLQENDKEYKNSLDATRETIVQNWTDTFKQMKGIVDVYWDEINEILSNKERFIAYMQESSSYKNASEADQAQMMYNWEQMYDNWFKSQDQSANDKHDDSWLDASGTAQATAGGSGAGTSTNAKVVLSEAASLVSGVVSGMTSSISSAFSGALSKARGLFGFSEGGLVPYTGLAMVHGTPSKPEAFLSADDTVMIRRMLDMFSYVVPPIVSGYNSENNGTTNNSIGEVHVTINEAEFSDDADISQVAQRVGEEFAKELSKQGFLTAQFNL